MKNSFATGSIRNSFLLLILVFHFSCEVKRSSELADGSYDLWIQNGQIYDGSEGEPFVADILINDDTIAYIGKLSKAVLTRQTIDASGMVVTPGFIDAHAHGDPLFGNHMNNFLAMGVTTVVLGQDGFHPGKIPFTRYAISLPMWMDSLEVVGAPLNVAMLAGHSTVRVSNGIGVNDIPSNDQVRAIEEDIENLLQQGCFGVSMGLEYAAAMNADTSELRRVAEVVGKYDRILMSHIRNEDEDKVDSSINELIDLGKYCNVHVAHLKVVYGRGQERAEEILRKIEETNNQGIQLTADVYPYIASFTTIGILFPEWAKTQVQFNKAIKERSQELRDYLYKRVMSRNGPEATLLAMKPYKGKTLAEAAEESNQSFVDVLMDLGPEGGSGAYFIMDDSLMSTFVENPSLMISSDGSPTMNHPRGYGAFSKVIRRYVNERKTLLLSSAIKKMTSLPAEKIGIVKRGILKVGAFADVLVFDPNEIYDQATYENPYQLTTGMSHVVINGKVVIEESGFVNDRSGRLLRKK